MSNSGSENLFDVKYKVLLLGDATVGKTSLQRFAAGKDFRPTIGSTIGVDFVNKIVPVEKARINLQIWDTAGQRNFRTLGRSYYSSTKAFILVYDVTNKETFHLIKEFCDLIEQADLDTERRYLVANKIDLMHNRVVDEEEGRRFALRNSMAYFETSCKTGENIDDLLEQVASDLVRQHNAKILESHRPIKENFAFNYRSSPIPTSEVRENTIKPSPLPSEPLFYQAGNKRSRFSFRRLLICCNPRKTTATMD
ncbi:unnamed protein product [Adineta ricciae]|uniref:Uncharacterized protein n=1 Tax=Adineta ricciae TaxID=249248 RepID=A0A815M0N9_ADIRI|nr:unnamed protein product [Adineta ricciae]